MIDWLKWYFSVPLRMLAALAGFFRANRQRVKSWMDRPFLALLSRAAVILTAIVWLLVALFGDGRHGEQLDQWMRDLRQTTGIGSD